VAALRSRPERDPLIPEPLPEPLGPGVYVHVPFCRVRCPYCDFATRPDRPHEVPGFVDGVLREAERRSARRAPDGAAWGSLFFGGGTPSRLLPDAFVRLAQGLDARLDFAPGAERTLEANPEDLDEARLAAWRGAGVNRLSIGAQSLHDDELVTLGRTHDAAAVAGGVRRARAAGFGSISVDLMYAFPGHRPERWAESLERALALAPDHVSAYAFTPEKGTAMGERVLRGKLARPNEDDEARAFEAARDALEARGFRHYEISNFARPGHVTRHHVNYWRRGEYLGLGPSAVSFLAGTRSSAPRDLVRWLAGDPFEHDDARPHALFETVFLGLRTDRGMRFADARLEAGAAAGDAARDALARWRDAARPLVALGWLAETPEGFRVPRDERARTDAIVLAWRAAAERSGPPLDSAASVH
jgi:oxygen-independent coproporphyrinogen-3 oxidase